MASAPGSARSRCPSRPRKGRAGRRAEPPDAPRRRCSLLVCTLSDSLAGSELPKQCLALLVAQAAQAAAIGDLELLHDLGRPDLADPRQRLKHGRDLELADDIVRLGALKDRRQRGLARLELLLQLSAGLADLRSLLQRGGALFGAQCGERHQFSSGPSPGRFRPGLWFVMYV